MELNQGIALIDNPALRSAHTTTWADLGCGDGFFTKALSSLLFEGSTIYAVDNNASALKRVAVPSSIILKKKHLDFSKDELLFGKIDGIIMANSIHYVKQQETFLKKIKQHILDDGILLIVEYDTDKGNPWVPYPVSYKSLEKLCHAAGFSSVEKINQMPSAFGRSNMYSAIINDK